MPAIAGIEVANDENDRNSGYFGGQNGAQNSDFLQNQAENQNCDCALSSNFSGAHSVPAGGAYKVSNESEMAHSPNFHETGGYFGAENGAQNRDFLQNQAENQNGDGSFAANLPAVGSVFGGDANQISNEPEMPEHTPNLTVFLPYVSRHGR